MERLELEAAMLEIVRRHVHVPELQRMMQSYVSYKLEESFVFAELVELHYDMFEGQGQHATAGAAAIELLILALDIFDDLQDKDNDRVPWMQVDPAQAMNAAIGFLSLSTAAIADAELDERRKSSALTLLHQHLSQAVGGQFMDVGNRISTEQECLTMIREKSGALVACACQLGTVLARGEMNEHVAAYGILLGLSAQIRNDMQGIRRWDTRNDLLFRKRTLPTLYLLEDASPELDVLRRYYAQEVDIESIYANKHEIMNIIEQGGCLMYTEIHLRCLYEESIHLFNQLNVEKHWISRLEKFI